MAAAQAPELRDRGDRGSGDLSHAPPIPTGGDRGRAICLALPQFPDAHNY